MRELANLLAKAGLLRYSEMDAIDDNEAARPVQVAHERSTVLSRPDCFELPVERIRQACWKPWISIWHVGAVSRDGAFDLFMYSAFVVVSFCCTAGLSTECEWAIVD